jgi:hypothetical protein
MLGLEVAHSDRADPALVPQMRERLEGVNELALRRHWPVDQIQIQVIDPESFDGGVERRQRTVVALVGVPQLGNQINLVAGYARFCDRQTGLTFVVVHCRGVDVPVTRLQGGAHSLFGVWGWNLENAEPDQRDRITVVQRD